MTTQNLLVELFVEELPPKALKKLGDAFASQLAEQLRAQGLVNADSVVTAYATPRRLGSLDVMELNPALDLRNQTAELAVDLIESLFGKSTLMRA